jgi:hypothetical protein
MRCKPHNAFRRSAWLALFALLFQALLPLGHHPADMASMDMAQMDMPGYGAGNLCMAPGTAPADPHKDPAHKPPPCPICQTLQMLAGGFIPPSPISLEPPKFTRLAADVPPAQNRHEQYIHLGARARAPPMRT